MITRGGDAKCYSGRVSGGDGQTPWAAILLAEGFAPHGPSRAPSFRRPVREPWAIEARAAGPEGPVDVWLTVAASAAGVLVGPVHRVLSRAALRAALPHVVAALEALANAAEGLRCSECNELGVLAQDEGGAFLACGRPGRGRRPFDRRVRRCRRSLVMTSLVVYGDDDAPA
jgi:hypothetical protein